MIATILKSSRTFSAVDYNERKVAKGKGELLEISNFGYLEGTDLINAKNLREYLIRYSAMNESIKNTQFHVAISCKGDSYTKEQLMDIAHQWLDGMGYGEPGQPLLIYAHHDTENTHIHIVTSRVAPDGHKIDHNNERRRSQAVLNRIMGVDRKKEESEMVKKAYSYSFETLGQFQAILESAGYESYKEGDDLNIKKDGVVLEHILLSEIDSHFTKLDKKASERRRKQIKAILRKYRDLSSNKEELRETMHKRFGIDMIFTGKKDSPYGYTIVDHKNKTVYKGSDVLPLRELLRFNSKKTSRSEIEAFIRDTLSEHPDMITPDINKMLIKEYNVMVNRDGRIEKPGHGFVAQLDDDLVAQLRSNNRLAWIKRFKPGNEMERDILATLFKVEPDKIPIGSKNEAVKKSEEMVSSILKDNEKDKLQEVFNEKKIIIFRHEGSFYAIDMKNKAILNIREAGIDVSKLESLHLHNAVKASPAIGGYIERPNAARSQDGSLGQAAGNILRPSGGGSNANREWEVGSHDSWDDIDDERHLKR